MDTRTIADFTTRVWSDSITPALSDYIAIPAKSPMFDADWAANGHMEAAMQLIVDWCKAREIAGLSVEVVRLEGRTPLIFMEVPAFGCEPDGDDTVLMYGHYDKQPEMEGWSEKSGPWEPRIEEGRLYGRGGADDGYAAFGSLCALEATQKCGGQHGRIAIVIEGCEESGSPDLPFYLEHLGERLGDVSLVICLDSGAGDYERLWSTTSLRGMAAGDLRIDILTEGIHSGDGSGIVPSSFRILRQLLTRIEDEETGRVLVPECGDEIPADREAQAKVVGEILGDDVFECYPFLDGAKAMSSDRTELVLNRTWRPTVSVTGVDGIPNVAHAGNVLRPYTTVKLSVRLAPTVDGKTATAALKETLEANPPYGSRVSFNPEKSATGWNAPTLAAWLENALGHSCQNHFGNVPGYMGEGGSIPLMGMLSAMFPKAQFLITGVLGPGSNAHGPNEFIDLAMAQKLTACVADVLDAHARR
ncbi:MAG: M20/M25/M40 family metallo-hydrolase [Planctomycetes bacterium]|jgi:acetylornithine deacetylase/succinyl-diaminopimelate desuccinylase-like protein|nr:M20/M25/M40 family metallo-hydrolase [Planctomycetota bacterium]MBT4029765.1 M20/M25/M40 family metallo-hydrolase [Planctomycetota bacterium]MBT4559844.1 M20/M25/M40 family metallo-hydrolase [Planctomycetota bacterium]MBT5119329.1 M20/M25/M40 family metallo-hydrolase [Planctomycetota bacterium]MBT7318350.1 M20/M25/M40 family metallo-hydrolase [Planctomycetota bacterium]